MTNLDLKENGKDPTSLVGFSPTPPPGYRLIRQAPRRRLTRGAIQRMDPAGHVTWTSYQAPDGTSYVRVRQRLFYSSFKKWDSVWYVCVRGNSHE